jgi:hypothetical protein
MVAEPNSSFEQGLSNNQAGFDENFDPSQLNGMGGAVPLIIKFKLPPGAQSWANYSPTGRSSLYAMSLLEAYYAGQLLTHETYEKRYAENQEIALHGTIGDKYARETEYIRTSLSKLTALIYGQQKQCHKFSDLRASLTAIDAIKGLVMQYGVSEEIADAMLETVREIAEEFVKLIFPTHNPEVPINPPAIVNAIESWLTKRKGKLRNFDEQLTHHLTTWVKSSFDITTGSCAYMMQGDEVDVDATSHMLLNQNFDLVLNTRADLVNHLMRSYFGHYLSISIIDHIQPMIDKIEQNLRRNNDFKDYNIQDLVYLFAKQAASILNPNGAVRLGNILFIAGHKAALYMPRTLLPKNGEAIIAKIDELYDYYLGLCVHFDPESTEIFLARQRIAELMEVPSADYIKLIEPELLQQLSQMPRYEIKRHLEEFPNAVEQVLSLMPEVASQKNEAKPKFNSHYQNPNKRRRQEKVEPEIRLVENETEKVETTKLISQRCIIFTEDGPQLPDVESKSELNNFIIENLLKPIGQARNNAMLNTIKAVLSRLAKGDGDLKFTNVVKANENFVTTYRLHFGPNERYRLIYALQNGYVFVRVVFRPNNKDHEVGFTKHEIARSLEAIDGREA